MSAAGWRARASAGDDEAAAVLVIFDGDRAGALWGKADPFVDVAGVDFAGMLGLCVCDPPRVFDADPELHDEDCPRRDPDVSPGMSSGERVLLELAANLWGYGPPLLRVDVAGLLATLDDAHLRVALDAIDARSRGRVQRAWIARGGRA